MLDDLPRQTWWNLKSFIEAIKEQHPDFQRPAGDYDSWFIRDAANGHYLRGFTDWDLVDGALIRFLLADVMHRLGLLDLASPGEGREASAFRILDDRESSITIPARGNRKAEAHLAREDRRGASRSQGSPLPVGAFLRVG